MSTRTQIGHFDTINTLEDANQAALRQGMALRIQPPAPGATRYYFTEDGAWKRQTEGHSHAVNVAVASVREAVRTSIPANDRSGGGGVKAVDTSQINKYSRVARQH
jgi:hypothetical protein